MPDQQKTFYQKTLHYFDKLEDKVRSRLSRKPILYSIVGGVAIVLFWRGVWMVADDIPFLTGPVSIILSVAILLMSGLFVSFFVGDRIVLSGLTQEKKLVEKTEEEIKSEMTTLTEVKKELRHIEEKIGHIEEIEQKHHH